MKNKKSILVILINNRRKDVPGLQGVLTKWGCIIKTRIGIHDGVVDRCSDVGLIILELAGKPSEHKKLEKELKRSRAVKTKLVELSL